MKDFPEERFREMEVGKYKVKVASGEHFEFPMPALQRMERQSPGNYVMHRGDYISIRTYDRSLVETVVERLGVYVRHYGGRVNWWGVTLNKRLGYGEFIELLGQ